LIDATASLQLGQRLGIFQPESFDAGPRYQHSPEQTGLIHAPIRTRQLKLDRLRTFPQHLFAQSPQIFLPFRNGQEVICRQLSHLRCKRDAAIAERRYSVSEKPPGYSRICPPGLECEVWFSNGTPKSVSPNGIHIPSPLQRTWMSFCSYGSSFRNMAVVFGASASNSARNWYGPAVMRTVFVFDILAYGNEEAGVRSYSSYLITSSSNHENSGE
jgi:hypothetical protein